MKLFDNNGTEVEVNPAQLDILLKAGWTRKKDTPKPVSKKVAPKKATSIGG